jgi:hypothetical protein
LAPIHTDKGRTLGKTYGIKVRFYRNTLGNTSGTSWELEWNTLETMEKWKNSSPPHQNLKEKN